MPIAVVALAILIRRIRRDGFTEWTFALALATGLVFSPYFLWAHFVLLIPILLAVARRNLRAAVLLYGSSWLIPLWGMVYPVAALAMAWYYGATIATNSTGTPRNDVTGDLYASSD